MASSDKYTLEGNPCCRPFCSSLNCGLASMIGNQAVAAIVAVLLLSSLLLNVMGVCGLASSSIFVTGVPWGVASVQQPDVADVSFTKFDVDVNMNIWGMCIEYDLEGTASGVPFAESENAACSSWNKIEDAVETGTAPFDCTPRFCDVFMNYTAVDADTREAFKDCKDSITGMQATVIIALLAVIIKFVTNNPIILLKFPDRHVREPPAFRSFGRLSSRVASRESCVSHAPPSLLCSAFAG